jgi:hypothetical protein
MDHGTLFGLYAGIVTHRDGPPLPGCIKVRIPGVLEPAAADHGPWAYPKGGGAHRWGKLSVPPVGATVYVQFLNGDLRWPVWEPAYYGEPLVEGVAVPEAFPEHTHPDVHVWGVGPFRLVLDAREEWLELRIVRTLGNVEVPTAWVRLIAQSNAIQVFAEALVAVESNGMVHINAPVVQVAERTVVANGRAIS